LEQIDKPVRDRIVEDRRHKLEPRLREALEIPKLKRTEEQAELAKNAEAQIKTLWSDIVEALPPEDLARRTALRQKLHAIEATKPPPLPAAYAVTNMEKAAP